MNDKQASVAAQVAALPSLTMPEVWALWDRFFQRRPDKTNRVYLESRIAYKLQEEAFLSFQLETLREIAIRCRLYQAGNLPFNHHLRCTQGGSGCRQSKTKKHRRMGFPKEVEAGGKSRRGNMQG